MQKRDSSGFSRPQRSHVGTPEGYEFAPTRVAKFRKMACEMLRKDAKMELLKQVPLFKGCSKKELGQIALIADEIDFPAGKTLIRQGETGQDDSSSSSRVRSRYPRTAGGSSARRFGFLR